MCRVGINGVLWILGQVSIVRRLHGAGAGVALCLYLAVINLVISSLKSVYGVHCTAYSIRRTIYVQYVVVVVIEFRVDPINRSSN